MEKLLWGNMNEVEVAFKVKQKQSKCEKLLKQAGYKLFWKAKTHDVYFSNKKLTKEMSEQELKFACVRIRCSNGGYSVDNFNIYNLNKENKFKCSKEETLKIEKQLEEDGFVKVFDTSKTDYVYLKNKSCHQLQNIEGIGLLDYYYDEDIFDKPENEQFRFLTQEMHNLGFELEYEEGVDKLRTLLSKKLCFSKNQNGNYNQMNDNLML